MGPSSFRRRLPTWSRAEHGRIEYQDTVRAAVSVVEGNNLVRQRCARIGAAIVVNGCSGGTGIKIFRTSQSNEVVDMYRSEVDAQTRSIGLNRNRRMQLLAREGQDRPGVADDSELRTGLSRSQCWVRAGVVFDVFCSVPS